MDHITVCICTYKRPKLLVRLLDSLTHLETEECFTYSIVIVDNDSEESARSIVEAYKQDSPLKVIYKVVTEKNIALVRNTTIKHATGNYIAFIDDDEFPLNSWLLAHYKALHTYNATGILGPVLPHFENNPPPWIVKSRICERERYKTGTVLEWKNTRAGNVLLKKDIFDDPSHYFDIQFDKGGEDIEFFKRLMKEKHRFIWCNEALVYETVPEPRLKFSYYLKRAYLRGYLSYQYLKKDLTRVLRIRVFLKSFIALSIYVPVLPFLLISGFYLFAKYLIKATDHFSRCLTILGVIHIKKRGF